MPPPLALLLCTIFVLFLLRLEHKQSPDVSPSLWVPAIWMLLISGKPLAAWFGVGGLDWESGSPLDRRFLIALLCLGLLILSIKRFSLSASLKENIWMVVLIGYMLVSVVWSDMPNISFRRWVRELVAVVMAFLVFSERNPPQALLSIYRRLIYILIPFSLLLIKYYPMYGIEFGRWSGWGMWIGVTTQKNGLARLCIMSVLFLVWTLIRRAQGSDTPVAKYQTHAEVFLLFLSLFLLMGPDKTFSYSATSTFALAIGLSALASLFWIKKRGRILGRNTMKVIVVLIIVYGAFTPLIGRLSFLDVSSAFGRDETLTGRTDIWAVLVPLAMSRQILGYGVGGFWTTEMRDRTSSNAHNGYLDVLLSLGFVGLILVSMFLFSCSHKAYSAMANDFDWGILFICYLLIVLVHNIAESSIDSLTSPMTAAVLLFSVSFPTVSRVADKHKQDEISSRMTCSKIARKEKARARP